MCSELGTGVRTFSRYWNQSATELEYQLALARDYGVLRYRAWQTLTVDTVDVRKMLFGLRAKVQAKERPAGQEGKNGQRKNGQRHNG